MCVCVCVCVCVCTYVQQSHNLTIKAEAEFKRNVILISEVIIIFFGVVENTYKLLLNIKQTKSFLIILMKEEMKEMYYLMTIHLI